MPGRFRALKCGRRWGKTLYASSIICKRVAGSATRPAETWGFFAPDYKTLSETYREIADTLRPIALSASKIEGVIRTKTGGRVDFWTLNNPRAGRSRRYHGVVIDEAAFTGDDMPDLFNKAIRPTLVDFQGCALALSTPNGKDPDNWFYQICEGAAGEWAVYTAPTWQNPLIAQSEIDLLRANSHPDVFRQEFEAEFVDWSGAAFFSVENMLVEGQPVDVTWRTDQIFAVVDTASKDGEQHDGTGVVYFARSKYAGHPLVILDWDVIQIEASLLIEWVPQIAERIEALARETNAREGAVGIWIEDKDSGIALLQSGRRRGLPVEPIAGQLTSLGKEGRAIAVSGYVYKGDVKLSRHAFDKTTEYRKQSRNHLLDQVCGFRMGQQRRDHRKDLLDCFTYGIAIALGNNDGY